MATQDIIRFIHDTSFEALPEDVVRIVERCCLDLVGVAVAGQTTKLSRLVTDHAVRYFGSETDKCIVPFTGRRASPAGAALATGMAIDSVDAHDGHSLTKGHAGAAVLPAALAFSSWSRFPGQQPSGREFLAMLAIGYEVSIRAGISLHATASDYHTSGAWNAIGCAAIGARYMGLDAEATRHALGIAEYHGPRSQMMRCIDHPTMLKDGSGWGAMTGVSAALLAESGFTGAPAVTLEFPAAESFWSDLGKDWTLLGQYFKPYPVCRWAQPAIQATANLLEEHAIDPDEISRIRVRTFHEALRLAGHEPRTTEEAQYAIAFPIAALLVTGELGVEQISGDALRDSRILALSNRIVLNESPAYNERFPAERWADVRIELADGELIESTPTCPRGDPDIPLSDEEIREKFERLCATCLDKKGTDALFNSVVELKQPEQSVASLLARMERPVFEQARALASVE